MDEVYCYGFVEDAPSREVALKLVAYRNQTNPRRLRFVPGFPSDVRGSGNLKRKCPKLLEMAKLAPVVCITDLDRWVCPAALTRAWFGVSEYKKLTLPEKLCFRIAVREIESWILADRYAWASYIGIDAANFPEHPDELDDPKLHLLNVIRSKGTKKMHSDMLPRGSAHIGPLYNEVLCKFVQTKWSPWRASKNSPSLRRAIDAIQRF